MTNLFHELERMAALGAEGLSSAARAEIAAALDAQRRPDGGYAGLDGRSDPYYSFFAWLSVRALGAPYDRGGVCGYLRRHLRADRPIDALCASLVLAREGLQNRRGRLASAASLLAGDARSVYGAFLLQMASRGLPRWLARLAWLRLRGRVAVGLPTPQLAAAAALAAAAGRADDGLSGALRSRRRPGGGFASATGAAADLLATASARFAIRLTGAPEAASTEDAADLAFVELCWQDDGLFGASPAATCGDAEHTFYGLLALGTCRPCNQKTC